MPETTITTPSSLLSVNDLVVRLNKERNIVRNISFNVRENEIFAILGEADSGKTTLAKAISGHTSIFEGTVYWEQNLAFGKQPNLIFTNALIDDEFDHILFQLQTTNEILQAYSEEYLQRFYKFVKNKFYDLKTKDTVELSKNRKNMIQEGINLQQFNIFSEKDDKKLAEFQQSLEIVFERIYQIIDKTRTQRHFLSNLNNDQIIDPQLINKLIEKLAQFEKECKELLNLLHDFSRNIDGIWLIKQKVHRGEYTSINLMFKHFNTLVTNMFKVNEKVANLRTQMLKDYFFINALLAKPSKRKKTLLAIDAKINESADENEVYDLDILKQLLNLDHIQKSINKLPKYHLPHGSHMRDIKENIQFLPQIPENILNSRVVLDQVLNEVIAYNYRIIKKRKLKEDLKTFLVDQNPAILGKKGKLRMSKKTFIEHIKELILSAVGFDVSQKSTYLDQLTIADKQRLQLALSIITPRKLTVFDEAISMLDSTAKSNIIKLLLSLKKQLSLTYVIVEKDPRIIKGIADTVAVMYNGKLLELAPASELFAKPLHPYTQFLLATSEATKMGPHTTPIVKYDPKQAHYDYDYDLPKWMEISKQHFVFANKREATKFKKFK